LLSQNLVKFDASVLRAFNPANCFYYFNKNGEEGWKSLGAILLCFTGVEALFADLGAFSARFGPPEDNLSNWVPFLFKQLNLHFTELFGYHGSSSHIHAYFLPIPVKLLISA
jgi:K+ transporter